MADSYDDFLTEQGGSGGGSGGGTATDDDSYAEFLRQQRQDKLAQQRAAQRAPQTPSGAQASPASPPAFDLSRFGLSPLPAPPPAGAPLAAAARTMVAPVAPQDVTVTPATDQGGPGLSTQLALEHESPSSFGEMLDHPGAAAFGALRGITAFGVDQLQMAEHPLEAATALGKRVVTAPRDVITGIGDLGARGITSGLERMGVTLPRSADEAPSYMQSTGKIASGLFDTALLTAPVAGAAADLAGKGASAAFEAAAGESRFRSALERAQADAMAARARKAGPAPSATGQGGPLALPSGQYDLGPASFQSRDVPETDPTRLLPPTSIGAGVPTEGPAVTAPIGMPAVDWESNLLQTKRDAAAATQARDAAKIGKPVEPPEVIDNHPAAASDAARADVSPEPVAEPAPTGSPAPAGPVLESGRPTALPSNTPRSGATPLSIPAAVATAGAGAIAGAAAAPPGERAEGAATGAIAALGLIGIGTAIARDGRVAESATAAMPPIRLPARTPMGAALRDLGNDPALLDDLVRPPARQPVAPAVPRTLAEMDAAGAPTAEEIQAARAKAGSTEPVTEADVAAARDRYEQRRAAPPAPAEKLPVEPVAAPDTPSAIPPAWHTPETVRAAADALPKEAEHDATREILGQVARTMEPPHPLGVHDAIDSVEENDAARDMAHTPAQFDVARKVLDDTKPDAPPARRGAADPKLIKTLGLAAAGAAAGGLTGDTPAERIRNAGLGLLVGGGLGALASREGKVLTAGEKAELGARATMERPAAGPKEAADAITATFAPHTRGEMAATAGQVVRAARGKIEREVAIAQQTLDRVAGDLNKAPIGKKLGFIDAIEHGAQQSDISRQPVANSIRRTLDTERDAIRDMGTGKLDQFLENYFPHLWQDPDAAGQWLAKIMGKRPIEGSKSFLKRRTIPTVLEGMFPQGVPKNLESMTNAELLAENKRQGGLVPVTFNPVEATMLKLREMKKYRMAQQVIGDLGERGLLKPIPEDGRLPVGYARVNDWAFTGKAAPEPVARVLNNYLSPGLRGNAAYDAYMAIGNTLNQAQLGFSAFHAGMTTIETMVSQNALALEHLVQGKAGQALREFATFPAAPFSNYKKGEELRRAYLSAPGTITGPIAAIADGAAEGGARYHADVHNQASSAFSNALEAKQYTRAAKQFLPAMMEKVMGPVMNELVPRQKMGVFYDLAKSELERLGPEAHPDEVTRAMQRAWDSVDNRMGQVVYDNLFWNKTAKDMFHASVRSVGWNWGTFNELGGGTKDLAGFVKDLATPGKTAELTHRAAYAMALPMTLGMLGAVTQYLYTGSGPDSLFDYFHPKTGTKDADGNDNRVVLPSYMKDVYGFGQHPVKTFTNKMNPLLSLLADGFMNKDFYGDQIYDTPDFHTSFMQSLLTSAKMAGQLGRYGAKATLPFGIENLIEDKKRGAGASEKAMAFVGITPASREAVRSRAQNLMHDALARRAPQLTPDEANAAKIRADLRDKVRTQGAAAAMAELRAHVRDGTLSSRQVQAILQDDQTPALVKNFKRLSLADAEAVYRASTSDREKKLWLPILEGKRARAVP